VSHSFMCCIFGSADENVPAKPVQYIPPPPMVPLSSIPYRLPGRAFASYFSVLHSRCACQPVLAGIPTYDWRILLE